MTTFERAGRIGTSADVVWRRMTDTASWPAWNASVTDAEVLDPGPLAVGQRTRLRQRRLPPTVWTVSHVTEGRSFTWESSAPGSRTVGEHVVEPAGPDACAVTLRLSMTGPLGAVSALLYGRLIRRYLAMELAGLDR